MAGEENVLIEIQFMCLKWRRGFFVSLMVTNVLFSFKVCVRWIFFLFCRNWRAYCNNQKNHKWQQGTGRWIKHQPQLISWGRGCLWIAACRLKMNMCASWNRSELYWIAKHSIYKPTQYLYPLPTMEGRTIIKNTCESSKNIVCKGTFQ